MAVASAVEGNPYVGPRPFERRDDDRARFFGRDREVDEIVSLVVSHPLVLVYAQSGAGKTSLFNTAVADALERKRFTVLPLARVSGGIGELDPGKVENLYVFNALLCVDVDADRDETAGMSLAEFLRRTREDEAGPRALVFDQFEELFTFELVYELYGDAWQDQQEAFFREVAEAVADDPMLRVVFLMRKEYLAELERFERLLPERLQTRFQLEPLDRPQALEAVECPLRGTPRRFSDGVAEKLVDRLLAMRIGPGRVVRGRFGQPDHLQRVCRRLWQDLPADATEITDEDVRAFGDVDVVLEQFYDRAVTAAAKAAHTREWKLRGKIESDFITSIGTRGTVYRTRDWERLAAALDELERRHVVSAEWRAGTRWYELAHDRLIDPIRTSNDRVRSRRRRLTLVTSLAVAAVAVAAALAVFVWGSNAPAASGPDTAVALISKFEGTRLKAYKDFLGNTVIGTSHLLTAPERRSGTLVIGGKRVRWKLGITPGQANELLAHDLAPLRSEIDKVVTVKLTTNQLNALTSFVWNTGLGALKRSLLKKLNAGAYDQVPKEMVRWTHLGAEVSPGLVVRRRAEVALWNKK